MDNIFIDTQDQIKEIRVLKMDSKKWLSGIPKSQNWTAPEMCEVMVDRRRLKGLAMAATPGERRVVKFYSSGHKIGVDAGERSICQSYDRFKAEDFELIAATGPDVVLELVRLLNEAEVTLEKIAQEFVSGEERKTYGDPTEAMDRIRSAAREGLSKLRGES